MALDKFRSSPLPNPPLEYDPQYVRQLIRVLETYFSQLDSNTPNSSQQYTATKFVGGSFTGTEIVAESMDTNLLVAHTSLIGYERADGIWTDALISYGHKAGRVLADDIMVASLYADYLYGDGTHVHTPYAQLINTATQTAAAIDQAYPVTFTANEYPDGITIASGSRVTFSSGGVYVLTPSLQLQSDSTGTETVNIWFRRNGTDLVNSNAKYSLPARKNATHPAGLVASSPFVIELAANDYVEIMWNPSSTSVSIAASAAKTYSAGVTPTVPATPSAFLNVRFVSAKFPTPTYVAPLPIFGFGAIGVVTVTT